MANGQHDCAVLPAFGDLRQAFHSILLFGLFLPPDMGENHAQKSSKVSWINVLATNDKSPRPLYLPEKVDQETGA